MGKEYKVSIFAPMTGQVVDLGKVPDPIYAERMLGDGVAIVPEDGVMFSPISGYVNVIAEDKHAFGFTSDDGLEILVHFGVNSKLIPECCVVHTSVNSRVQAGDMIAEFDLEKAKALGVETITPVIICGGLEGKVIRPATGHVMAGSGAVITVVDAETAARQEAVDDAVREKTVQGKDDGKESSHAGGRESEALEFLRDKKNWPVLIGGFVGLTVALVIIFVGLAMLIGH